MNIAEILKYCPKGTKLYSTVHGEVVLRDININEEYPIVVDICYAAIVSFTKEGYYVATCPDAECILFPSKDQRDWNNFRLPVKKGDIMMSDNKAFIISDEYADVFHGSFHKYICGIDANGTFKVNQSDHYWTSAFYIPASEEAKKELFDKMAEAGYRWNADTLELEKIEPKFKEGDVIRSKGGNLYLISNKDTNIADVKAALYKDGDFITYNTLSIEIKDLTLATKKERNKFYSALVREGYKYNKKQHKLIKQEFKPFDKVLVRDKDTESWNADIYLDYLKSNPCPYRCTRTSYKICIPYEGNEYLLGTTDSPTCTDKKE